MRRGVVFHRLKFFGAILCLALCFCAPFTKSARAAFPPTFNYPYLDMDLQMLRDAIAGLAPPEAPLTITDITSGAPAVIVTYTGGNTLANGDIVYIDGVTGGMAGDVNGQRFTVTAVDTVAQTFQLQGIDGTAFGGYGGGGTALELAATTPALVARFNDLARPIPQIDRGAPPGHVQVCVPDNPGPGCTNQDEMVEGGQHLLNQIINALGGTAPADGTTDTYEWFGPGNGADNMPTDVKPVLDLLDAAIGGDIDALKTIQNDFLAQDFFQDLGALPEWDPDGTCDPGCPLPLTPTGQNMAVTGLAYIVGGTEDNALRTIALAMNKDPGAMAVMTVIFSYPPVAIDNSANVIDWSTCWTTGNQPNCAADNSFSFYAMLDSALQLGPQLGAGDTPTEIMENALAGNTTAQGLIRKVIEMYLDPNPCDNLPAGMSLPDCTGNAVTPGADGYIGPAAITFLTSAITNLVVLSNPEPPPPPPDPGSSATRPDTGLPDGGGNDADAPCEVDDDDVELNEDGFDGRDPCRFTRDTRNLVYAKEYKGGEQWDLYFEPFVNEQWIPALKAMTAQLSAAIIDQTRMIGSVMDAAAASKRIMEVQKRELKMKREITPSDLSCTSASGLSGMAYTESASNALRHAFTNELTIRSGTGVTTPPPGP